MITVRTIAVASLAVALGAGAAEAVDKPTPLCLEPMGEGVAQGVGDEKCVSELQAAFGAKRWRFVAMPEEAEARLEIRECVVHVKTRAATTAKKDGGEIRGPQPGHRIIPGGAHAIGSEEEYGVALETERQVLLVVRLSIGERFADLSSDKRDKNLKQAASTVAKQAEKSLADAPS